MGLAKAEPSITVNDSPTDHVEVFVAPLGVSEITAAGTALRQFVGTRALRRILAVVEASASPSPRLSGRTSSSLL